MTAPGKIRLLIITPTLQCGGSEKYVTLLCDHLDSSRFDIWLAVLDNSDPFFTVKAPGVKVVDLKTKRVRSSVMAIRRLVKEQSTDIVFSVANHLTIYLSIFRRLFPKRVRFIARESSLVSKNSERSPIPFYSSLVRSYYKRIDFVICQSKAMQEDLIAHYGVDPAKTAVIMNPVVAMPYTGETIAMVAGKKAPVFITVARLSPEKGIDRLIRAVALLDFAFTYHIVGEGEERIALENLIKELGLSDKVYLHGQKPEPFKGFENADLFLVGSHYEGLPNAVLEGGALGIPAIAFESPGGMGEIIINGENGLLVSGDDVQVFAIAIEEAMMLPMDRDQVRKMTVERFNVEGCVKKVENVIKILV